MLSEISGLRENVLKSSQATIFSANLTRDLMEASSKAASILGLKPQEAIADPNINVIDSHVSQITKGSKKHDNFQPELRELVIPRSNEFNNLYRENFEIRSIKEETKFVLGYGVESWKVLPLDDRTALIGSTSNSIMMLIGSNDTYQHMKTLEFEVPVTSSLRFEVVKIWDSNQGKVRNLVLVAVGGRLIWHELFDSDLVKIHEWNLLKEIDSMAHFTHEGKGIWNCLKNQ